MANSYKRASGFIITATCTMFGLPIVAIGLTIPVLTARRLMGLYGVHSADG